MSEHKALGTIGIALLSCAVLFTNLGSNPDRLIHWEALAIHPAVDSYAKNEPLIGSLDWRWNNGGVANLDGASTMPPTRIFLGSGIRIFGLNLFGLRFFTALLSLIAMVVLFRTAARYLPEGLAATFVALLVTSPFFLVHARSALPAATTLDWVILCLCSLVVSSERSTSLIFPVIAGLLVGMLSYFYTIARPIALIMFFAPLVIRPMRWKRLGLYYMSLCAVLSVQLLDVEYARSNYLSAGGETIFTDYGTTWARFACKLLSNARDFGNVLFGMNYGSSTPMVHNLDKANITIYPVFLVPFFIVGLVTSLRAAVLKKSRVDRVDQIVLAAFCMGIIPALGVGRGYVNGHRLILLAPPIYYFLATGIFAAASSVSRHKRLGFVSKSLSIALIIASMVYQLNDYFHGKREWHDNPEASLAADMIDYFKSSPSAVLMVYLWRGGQQYYNSKLRLDGAPDLIDRERAGQINYYTSFEDISSEKLDSLGVTTILTLPAWKGKFGGSERYEESVAPRSGYLLLKRK